MILATDVAYDDVKGSALAAGVVFADWQAGKAAVEHTVTVRGTAPYEPGSFYKRELPCLLALLAEIKQTIDVVIVDGYVDMAPDHPGLGRHLYNALNGKVTIVGVAKTHFAGTTAAEVRRGESASPLYVTAAGIDLGTAIELVQGMHGPHRMPTLLKRVDHLSRGWGG